ncbi:MAG: MATE family efflux transporter [Sphingomonadaceae bacterium]
MSEIESPVALPEPAPPPAARAGMLDLTQGTVGKTLFRFSLPTLGSNVLQSLNGSISAIYVGKFLGESAFAAAGISNMVIFLIFSTVFGLAMAATIMVGQAMGRGDELEVRRTIGATAGAFAIASVVLGFVGWFIIEPMLYLLATPEAAFAPAVAFLKVVFATLPVVFIMILLQSALRGVGDAVTPLWSTVINVGLSLVLNPVLILGFGPVPALGLPGAALAGALANLICLVFMVWRIYRLDLPIRLNRDELYLLKPDWGHLKPILTIGVPMSLSMVVMSLSSLVMIGLVNREGVETVAAYNAATQLWNYIQMPAFAVSSAVSAMAAQNIGAGRWDRIGQLARVGAGANVAMTTVLIGVLVVAGPLLLGLFLPLGSPAIDIGQHINLLIGWTFIPMGVSMVMTSIVRANGAVIAPFVILFVSVIVVRMSVGFGFYPMYRADAIWWAFIASSTSSALLSVLYYLKGNWRAPKRSLHGAAPDPAM